MMVAMTPLSQVYWYHQRARPRRDLPPLAGDTKVDIVVVGGGVAGLTCAQALSEQGHRVLLLEQAFCGSGASGRSSGFITPDSEMELSDLVRSRGVERARRLWEFVVSGVDDIRLNIERHGIDCDFQVQDSLFLANSPKGAAKTIREHDARTRVGYESTLYDANTIRSVLTSKECCGGVRYSGTFGINAYLYCQALRDILRESGVTIHEQSRVTEVDDGRVKANGFTVRADHVVLCVDHCLPELGELPTEVYHLQTFLAASAPLSDAQISSIFPESRLMVWDSDLIYQYFRVTGDNRLLLGGSSAQYTYAHKQHEEAPRIVRRMRAFARKKFPQTPVEIEYFWPGLIGVSKDLLPLAAQDASRPAISFVSGATGLAWAAALGRYMAEKIVSSRSDFDAEFDPGRSFVVGPSIQRLIGKPGAFALSHGVVKLLR
ncbi:MAG TPA: FAD-binding oxidoreductase [Gemmatimonadaceae bacterium]